MRALRSETKRSIHALAGALGLVGFVGCVPPPPVASLDGHYESPLNGDLREAVKASETQFRSMNVKVRWAGIRYEGSTYAVERGPLGEPLRESVLVLYGFDFPARNKCFLSYEPLSGEYNPRMSREHLGGGKYGPPHFIGMPPLGASGDPTGREVICSALDEASGGVHAGDASNDGTALAGGSPPTADAASTTSATVNGSGGDGTGALANLSPALPKACADYAKAACSNPKLPAGTDRAYFCTNLVEQTNALGKKPNADKTCKGMLKATQANGAK